MLNDKIAARDAGEQISATEPHGAESNLYKEVGDGFSASKALVGDDHALPALEIVDDEKVWPLEKAKDVPTEEIVKDLEDVEPQLTEEEKAVAERLAKALHEGSEEDVLKALSEVVSDDSVSDETLKNAIEGLRKAYKNNGINLGITATEDGDLLATFGILIGRDGSIFKLGGRR